MRNLIGRIGRSTAATAVLFAVAGAFLLGGSIGAVQAAPRVASADYRAEVSLASVATTLVENGVTVEGEDALLGDTFRTANAITDGEGFQIGRAYDEKLSVRNTGAVDEYVRVTLYTYWVDGGGKAVDLDPGLIELELADGSGWTVDDAASTPERTVLYYASAVPAGGETAPFATSVAVDPAVIASVTKLADGSDSFDYEGVTFKVKAVADAVQTHNGEAAMTGAWGRTN